MRRFGLICTVSLLMLWHLVAQAGDTLRVTDAWMRALPPGQPNSAAYMTLENAGAEPLTIVEVRSGLARRVEIHESSQRDGMWRMQAVGPLTIAPGHRAELAPGGKHFMLFGLTHSPQPGEEVQFLLVLRDGRELSVSAQVKAVGPDGGHGHHQQMMER